MFFFTRTRKPKSFNFKPVYFDPKKEELNAKLKEEDKVISIRHAQSSKDKMYSRWDRISFSEVHKQGKRRVLTISIIVVVLLIGFAFVLERVAFLLEQN